MPKITIDGQDIDVPEGITILQAIERLGIEVPVFCYHPKLSIAGNCRMCLVEMEHAPKPIASCAMPVCEGMVIHTNTPMVQESRKGNLEFLLINHPLDCPICDQGGECDLQDITVAYGSDSSRYDLNKRAVPNLELGPLIETSMNRCIQCTRCVRFASEIAGSPELGALGRGEDMAIETALHHTITSELSGNLIDICPVGALTSKPYSGRARSWELTHTPSIDVMDAVGSAIRIDTRGPEVMRILPRPNDAVNEDWISDKTRFFYDGLKYQRLDTPYVRKNGVLKPVTWNEAFKAIAKRLKDVPGEKIAAIAGDLADAESMVALKDVMRALGSPHTDCRQDSTQSEGPRCSYLFNTTIGGIEQADACLLIGTNTRWEAPLVNARLRKACLASGLPVARIGAPHDLGYLVEDLGADPRILEKILKGRHPFSRTLKAAKNPMVILGQSVLKRPDSPALLHVVYEIANKYGLIHPQWNGFNVLHTAASRVGGLDLGFLPGPQGRNTPQILQAAAAKKLEVVYLLGVDEIDLSALKNTFVIYQGHHGDRGAHYADVILPGAACTEKSGTYVNTEGRVQRSFKAVFPPGEAKEDWRILRALSETLGETLPYHTLAQVRERLVAVNPLFEETDTTQRAPWEPFGTPGEIAELPFEPVIQNFYMTDPISRHSLIMARCTTAFREERVYG